MNRDTELVPIDQIIVEDRLREDYGDIDALAESIREHGLIHPIAIDQDNRLIAGERRLRAMRKLEFLEVECRRWDNLGDDERRVLELEENLRRKDLTSYERDKNLVEYASAVAEADRRQAAELLEETRGNSPQASRGKRGASQDALSEPTTVPRRTRTEPERVPESAETGCGKSPQPRPQNQPKPGSLRRVAERVGTDEKSIRNAHKRVEGSDRYPFLQQPGWNQYRAMEAADLLDTLPEADRVIVVGMASEPGVDPTMATRMIKNLAESSETNRKRILALATSDDDRDRALAKNRAAAQPAAPDRREGLLGQVIRDLRTCLRGYPDDPEAEDLKRIITDIKAIQQSIKERHQRRVEDAA